MSLDTSEAIRERLGTLHAEHQQLNETIERLSAHPAEDELMIRRMKKRKLLVKDSIRALEALLDPTPDEYA